MPRKKSCGQPVLSGRFGSIDSGTPSHVILLPRGSGLPLLRPTEAPEEEPSESSLRRPLGDVAVGGVVTQRVERARHPILLLDLCELVLGQPRIVGAQV